MRSGRLPGMGRDDLVSSCLAAVAEDDPPLAAKAVLEQVLAEGRLGATLASARGRVEVLHSGADVTILDVVWPPLVSVIPHDHRMWAVIGVYGGEEDNAFYRRDGSTLVARGRRRLGEGEVAVLGSDAIHAVRNPRRSHAGAIHVYGGDFLAAARSQWDPVTRVEAPYDLERARQAFVRAEMGAR